MTIDEAMATAQAALDEAKIDVTIKPHYGNNPKKDIAIRVSGCFPERAARALQVIERAIPDSSKSQASGFAAVWLPRLTKSGTPDRRSATAAAQAAAMTPEQRTERGKKAIAARWAVCRIQMRLGFAGWTSDGIGENPSRPLAECRDDMEAIRALASTDPEWAGEYRIVQDDGSIKAYYEI